jgi:hypothetical protein
MDPARNHNRNSTNPRKQLCVVRVRADKEAGIVCVAVVVNTNVCAPRGIIFDCFVLLFGFQRKFPRREIVRILQRKEKPSLQRTKFTDVSLPSSSQSPEWLHVNATKIICQN